MDWSTDAAAEQCSGQQVSLQPTGVGISMEAEVGVESDSEGIMEVLPQTIVASVQGSDPTSHSDEAVGNLTETEAFTELHAGDTMHPLDELQPFVSDGVGHAVDDPLEATVRSTRSVADVDDLDDISICSEADELPVPVYEERCARGESTAELEEACPQRDGGDETPLSDASCLNERLLGTDADARPAMLDNNMEEPFSPGQVSSDSSPLESTSLPCGEGGYRFDEPDMSAVMQVGSAKVRPESGVSPQHEDGEGLENGHDETMMVQSPDNGSDRGSLGTGCTADAAVMPGAADGSPRWVAMIVETEAAESEERMVMAAAVKETVGKTLHMAAAVKETVGKTLHEPQEETLDIHESHDDDPQPQHSIQNTAGSTEQQSCVDTASRITEDDCKEETAHEGSVSDKPGARSELEGSSQNPPDPSEGGACLDNHLTSRSIVVGGGNDDSIGFRPVVGDSLTIRELPSGVTDRVDAITAVEDEGSYVEGGSDAGSSVSPSLNNRSCHDVEHDSAPDEALPVSDGMDVSRLHRQSSGGGQDDLQVEDQLLTTDCMESSLWDELDQRVSVTMERAESFSQLLESELEQGGEVLLSSLEREGSLDARRLHPFFAQRESLDEGDDNCGGSDGCVVSSVGAIGTELPDGMASRDQGGAFVSAPDALNENGLRSDACSQEEAWESSDLWDLDSPEGPSEEGEELCRQERGRLSSDYGLEFSPAPCDHSPSPKQRRSRRRSHRKNAVDDIDEVLDGFLESCHKQSFTEEFPTGDALRLSRCDAEGQYGLKWEGTELAASDTFFVRSSKDNCTHSHVEGLRGNYRYGGPYELHEESCSELDLDDEKLEDEDRSNEEEAEAEDLEGREPEVLREQGGEGSQEMPTTTSIENGKGENESWGEGREEEGREWEEVKVEDSRKWEDRSMSAVMPTVLDGRKRRRREKDKRCDSEKKYAEDYFHKADVSRFSICSTSSRQSSEKTPVRRVRQKGGKFSGDVRGSSKGEKELRRSLCRESGTRVSKPKHRHSKSLDSSVPERCNGVSSAVKLKEEKEGVEAWRNTVRENIRHHQRSATLGPDVMVKPGGTGSRRKAKNDRGSLLSSSLCGALTVWSSQFKRQIDAEVARRITKEPIAVRDDMGGESTMIALHNMVSKGSVRMEKSGDEAMDNEWVASGHARMGGGVDPDDLRRRLEIVAADRRTDKRKGRGEDFECDTDDDWAVQRAQDHHLDESVTQEWDRLCDELFEDIMIDKGRKWADKGVVYNTEGNDDKQGTHGAATLQRDAGGKTTQSRDWKSLGRGATGETLWQSQGNKEEIMSRGSSISTPPNNSHKEVAVRDLPLPLSWGMKLANSGVATTLAVIGGLALLILKKRSSVRPRRTVKVARR
ncbi:hypothetical protein CBR_g36827 [Chara braunii]|uniref:Transmembrane protein n=1 Tax=Chara braunii TaxID=69332 RepID=A0A388LLV5_CHABU|nr:hypothetical protein CBR_g36827 [Chara braunii]|eukprot:GBG83213.1 hypothetical protein CBR_g36827 [Chara braunii]